MNKINVYQFKCFRVNDLEEVTSDKYASLETIKRIKCSPLEDSKIQIENDRIDNNGFYLPAAKF